MGAILSEYAHKVFPPPQQRPSAPLDAAARRRYARHLLLPEVGEPGQARLMAARALVIGAGGLGSVTATYLAAAGVGVIGIIDDDLVEESNLQRQVIHDTAAIGMPKVASAARRLQAINIVGGGAASAVWCQIHADVLGRTIRQVADPIQINVRGAALLAAVALGYASFEDVGSWVRIARVFEPQPQHQPVYDAIFREYVNIYKLNRGIYARLNGG